MGSSGFLLVLGFRGSRVHGLGFLSPKPATPKALNPLPPMVHPIVAQGSLHFPAWLFEATLFGPSGWWRGFTINTPELMSRQPQPLKPTPAP